MVVSVDLRHVFCLLDCVRDEEGMTGFVVRRRLALMLDLQKPSDEEIDAYVRAEMVRAGAKEAPLAQPVKQWKDIDADWWEWGRHIAEPLWSFVGDAELWAPVQDYERLPA